jgi:hypothetical protein
MALRLSTALRQFLIEQGSFEQAFTGGKLEIYSGVQPTLADDAPVGTLLATYTDNAGAHTPEVQSVGSVALTGGGAGSVNTLTVNGVEIMGSATNFLTSLAVTAQAIVDKINANPKNKQFTATLTSTSTITITAKLGMGTLPNGWVVASTVTTITKTDTNMSGGVNSVNGLSFGAAAAGVLAKLSTQTWSGTAGNSGTAQSFRLKGPIADADGASNTTNMRLDGNISTSGANLNLNAVAIVAAVLQTISSFSVTEPAT